MEHDQVPPWRFHHPTEATTHVVQSQSQSTIKEALPKREFYCYLNLFKEITEDLSGPLCSFSWFCSTPGSQELFSYPRPHWWNKIRNTSFPWTHETPTVSPLPLFSISLLCVVTTPLSRNLHNPPSASLGFSYYFWSSIKNARRTCLAKTNSRQGQEWREWSWNSNGKLLSGRLRGGTSRTIFLVIKPCSCLLAFPPCSLSPFVPLNPACCQGSPHCSLLPAPTGIEILRAPSGPYFWGMALAFSSTAGNSTHLTANHPSGTAVIYSSTSVWGRDVKNVNGGDSLPRQPLTEYLFYSGPKCAPHCCLCYHSSFTHTFLFQSYIRETKCIRINMTTSGWGCPISVFSGTLSVLCTWHLALCVWV